MKTASAVIQRARGDGCRRRFSQSATRRYIGGSDASAMRGIITRSEGEDPYCPRPITSQTWTPTTSSSKVEMRRTVGLMKYRAARASELHALARMHQREDFGAAGGVFLKDA